MAQLTGHAEELVPGISEQRSWDQLKGDLLCLQLDGHDPIEALRRARDNRPLDGARDPAAVLHWRINPAPGHQQGPLPWLPALPQVLADDPTWGPYLAARGQAITDPGCTGPRSGRPTPLNV